MENVIFDVREKKVFERQTFVTSAGTFHETTRQPYLGQSDQTLGLFLIWSKYREKNEKTNKCSKEREKRG